MSGKALAEIGTPDVPLFIDTVKLGRVFARVTPLQKLQIVDSLVKLGHFVAVTGDGVNDAPALKRAHIGVAMGSGTDVTKETASIIVTDDNFASIEAGVEEGRFAYDNIRKVTYLLISTGLAEVLLFALTLLTGMPLPLLPVQLLWLNLVANGIQDVSLAFEGGEPGAMSRPPRKPTEGVFNRFMVQQTVVAGVTMALLAYVNFYLLVHQLGLSEFDARNRLLLLMVLVVNYHAFNCRSEYVSAFRVPLRRNWMLVWGVLGAQGILLVSYAAVKMGAVDLAVGNVLGSNLFNIAILAVDDAFFLRGPILASIDPSHAITALAAMTMTALMTIALTYPSQKRVLLFSWESTAVALAYVLASLALYARR